MGSFILDIIHVSFYLKWPLRTSSHEPAYWAGPVSGNNFVLCSYGPTFQPGYRAGISVVAEMNTVGPFKFHPGNRAGAFIWEKFQSGYRDLGNRASLFSHMNTSKFLQRKER